MKVYLAGGISDTDRKEGQKRTAEEIRKLGYKVYAAAENDSINDKRNNPTSLDIYNGDIERVKESDIFLARISGGNEDGTISEIGMVAGWNEKLIDEREFLESIINLDHEDMKAAIAKRIEEEKTIKLLAYLTNERLMLPQFWNGIASAGFNALVAGMIDKWGNLLGGEADMIEDMEVTTWKLK